MTIKLITSFPNNPSRVSDPDNFGTEAIAFLAQFPDFVSDFNEYANDINSLVLNPYDWGALGGIPSTAWLTFRPFIEFPTLLTEEMNGKELVLNLDALFLALKTTSTSIIDNPDFNRFGLFVENLSEQCTVSFSDSEKPSLIEISDAPTQAQPDSNFIERSYTFFPSVVNAVNKLKEFEQYIYVKMVADEDWENVSDDLAFEDYEG